MKTIGIIGGLSPESTLSYYKEINDAVRHEFGGNNSAKIIIWSVNFEEFCQLKAKGDWDTQSKILCDTALKLKDAGADFILLATNTMHKMADDIQSALGKTPLLHLADATADVAIEKQYKRIGFLGTKYSMELDFYTGRLVEKGLEPLIPEENERAEISRIIYDELTKGEVKQSSIDYYIQAIEDFKSRGAQAVILGCTEIGMLINEGNSPLPVLDTTKIHVAQAVKTALS